MVRSEQFYFIFINKSHLHFYKVLINLSVRQVLTLWALECA